jgi:XapX domain-containing protein
MMMKTLVGLWVAFSLGGFCRWMDIPAPAPPKLVGALLVVAATLGYMSVDKLLAR